jgi:hypothetical protein
MDVVAWKKKASELTIKVNALVNEYTSVLNEWEEARNEAGDPGKHEVDECFRALSDARSRLCALRGGKRKQRRTRKHRR